MRLLLSLLLLALTLPVQAANTYLDHIVSLSMWRGIDTFGCVGDGVTDNTLTLSNAFNANVPLFVPPGVWYVATPLTNSGKAFVNIRGSGTNSVFLSKIKGLPTSLTNWVSQNVITFTNCQNINIQDVWFDGGISGVGYSNIWDVLKDTWLNQQSCLQLYNCTNVTLLNVWTTRFHGSIPIALSGGTPCPDVNYQFNEGPVYLNRCESVKIIGCGIRWPAYHEGWSAVNCSNIKWIGFQYTRLPSDGFDDTLAGKGVSSAINCVGIESKNVEVLGSVITAHLGSAMNLSAIDGLSVKDNTIVGGTAPFGIFSGGGIDAGAENGIGNWTNYPVSTNIVIEGNSFRMISGAAINVAVIDPVFNPSVTNVFYRHLMIKNNDIDGAFGGIIIGAVQDLWITQNHISRCVMYAPTAWYGQSISLGYVNGGRISNNMIDGTEEGLGTNLLASATYGIVSSDALAVQIWHNTITNMTASAVYLAPTVDTADTYYSIRGNASFGTNALAYRIGYAGHRVGTAEMTGNTHNGLNAFAYTATYATNLVGDDMFTSDLIPFGPGPMHSSDSGFMYNSASGTLWVKTNVFLGNRLLVGTNSTAPITLSANIQIIDPVQAQQTWEISNTNFGNISYTITNGFVFSTKDNGSFFQNQLMIQNGLVTTTNLAVDGTVFAPFGFMSISNLATHVTLSGSGTYATVTNWDVVSLNKFTSSAVNTTGGTLTNSFPGWYRVFYSVTCTPGNSDTVEVDLGINGVSSDLIAAHQTASNPAKSISLSGGGVMYLNAGTAVSLRLQNQNSTTIGAFDHAQLVIGTP